MTTKHVKLISLDNPHDHYINNEPVVPSNIIIIYNYCKSYMLTVSLYKREHLLLSP